MKHALIILLLPLLGLSCRTSPDSSQGQSAGDSALAALPEYDGSAETIDALPDCNHEMASSLFWVRAVKTAFICAEDGQWTPRGHQDPDDI